MVALKHFPNIDKDKALNRPILYSNWLSKVRHKRLFFFYLYLLIILLRIFRICHFDAEFACTCRTTSQWNRRS